YMELKPKGIAEEQFLTTLQSNKIYKTALAGINSENLAAQESFDPKQYIDFDKEKGTKQPRGKAPENIYQIAKFAAQIVPNSSLANGKSKNFNTA
ncbi:MAG: hypothetical protein GWP15_03340, partial [Nitrospirae bacterium]|nr:hypothetical protein [Nitrospirota bacterium]